MQCNMGSGTLDASMTSSCMIYSCRIAECCGWKPGNPMAQGPGFGLGTPSHGPLSLSGYSIFRSFLEEGKIH